MTTRRPRAATRESAPVARVFALLLAGYFVVLYPILRADRLCNDDLKRALIGRTGWDSNGRPLTTLLMKLLQAYDHALVDISPLTQLGGIALLALAGALLVRRWRIRPAALAALVVFPLGAQPFFLENLTYAFDALSMSLALLLAVLPFAFGRNGRRVWLLGALSLFASLALYQPAICVALVLVAIELVLGEIGADAPLAIARRAALRIAQIAAAMLVYEVLIGIHVNGWVRDNTAPVHDPGAILANLGAFAHFVGASFGAQWWIYFGPLLGLLALIATVAGAGYALAQRRAGATMAAMAYAAGAIALPLFALAAVAGPMLALAKPLLAPRVMVGVGALLAGCLAIAHRALRRWRRADAWTYAAAGMLALGLGVIASAYGNALGAQKAYEDRIAARLADDLAALRAAQPVNAIVFTGSAGYAPEAAHAAAMFPLIASTITPYLDAANRFALHSYIAYFVDDFAAARFHLAAAGAPGAGVPLAAACRIAAREVRSGYRLTLAGGVAVVEFGSAASAPTDACADRAADAARTAQLWTRAAPDTVR